MPPAECCTSLSLVIGHNFCGGSQKTSLCLCAQASKKKTSSNATEEAVAGNTAKKTAVRKGAAVRKKAPVPTSKPKTTRARCGQYMSRLYGIDRV